MPAFLAVAGGAGLVVGSVTGQPLVWLAVLAIAVGLAALRSFTFATVLLLAVQFLRLSEIGARDRGIPTFALPMSVGLVCLVFLSGRDTEQASRQIVRLLSLVIAYLAAMLMSTLLAGDPARSMRVVATTVRDIAMAVALVALITNVRRLHAAVWAIVSFGGLLGVLGWLQHATGTLGSAYGGLMGPVEPAVIGGADRLELSGPELSPNFFAKVLMVVAILACERALHARRASARLFALAAAVCCVAAIFFTYSRGALVALVAGVVVLLFGAGRRHRAVLLAGLAIGAAVFFITQAPLVTHLLNASPGSAGTSSSAQADTSIAGRTSEYRVSVDMFVDHPVFGVGRKNFDRLYQSYAVKYGLDDRAGERGVPNMWLEALAELGLVGALALAAVPVSALVLLRGAQQRFHTGGDHDSGYLSWGVLAAICGFLVNSMFEGGRSIYALWVLVALGVAAEGISLAGGLPRNNRSASDTLSLSNSATGTA
jgi:O-antigen ligase